MVSITRVYIPVEKVLAPEDLLPGLAHQGIGRKAALALVESELVAKVDSQPPVPQKAGVVSFSHAVHLRQHIALQGRNGNIARERFERGGPVSFEESRILIRPRLVRGLVLCLWWCWGRHTVEARAAIPKMRLS